MNHFRNPFQIALGICFLLILGVSLFATIRSGRGFDTRSRASSNTVSLSVLPSTVLLNPEGTVDIVLQSGSTPIGFVAFTVTFDSSRVQVQQDITTPRGLPAILKKTSLEEANRTGKIQIIQALFDPSLMKAPPEPPVGLIKLAQFHFKETGTKSTSNIPLSFVKSSVQVLSSNKDTSNPTLSVTTKDGAFTLPGSAKKIMKHNFE